MANSVLNGKPDAENRHVRFDEKKNVSPKPRRSYLLYIGLITTAALCGAAYGEVAATSSDGGATLTLSGSGEYGTAIPATVTKIVKTGSDKVTLTQDSTTTKNLCAGVIEIQAGTLGGKYYSSWGSPTKITVTSGATLDLSPIALDGDDAERKYTDVCNAEIVLAGTGVGGVGALTTANGYYGKAYNMFTKLTLAGNALVNNASDISFNDVMNLAGFTLTKKGGAQFYIAYGTVKPGHIVVENGNMIAAGGPTFEGDETSTVTVNGGMMMLNNFNASYAIPWSLKLNGGILGYWSGTPVWAGPVTLLCDSTLRLQDPDLTGRFLGPVNASNHVFTIYNATGSRVEFCGATDMGKVSIGPAQTTLVYTNSADRVIDVFDFNADAQRVEFIDAGFITFNTNSAYKVAGLVNDSSGTKEQNVVLKIQRAKTASEPPPRVVVAGDTTIASYDAKGDKIGRIYVGCGGDNFGVLEIRDGAVVTNDFYLGLDNGSVGAIYQRGGDVVWLEPGTSTRWSWFGYGYYSLAGGTFRTGASPIMSINATGCTMIRQSGGDWIGSAVYKPFTGYFGVLMDGGTLTGSYITLNNDNVGRVGNDSMAECTFSGAETVVDMSGYLSVCHQATNDYTAIVNVNDGAKLKIGHFNFAWSDGAKACGRTVRSYLNLNGGVLMPKSQQDFFLNNASLSRCTVHAGGVVFDTSEMTAAKCVVKAALQKPEGRGIKSIALPTDAAWLAETNHLGPMRVKISGGSGVGASAFMDFDDTNRVVRGIFITSPGSGYAADDTVTCTVDGQFRTTTYNCQVTLTDADLVGGGLVKRGAKTLSLTGTNTYAGPTRIEDGTVAFESAAAYPGGDVELPATTLLALSAGDPVLFTAVDFAPNPGAKIRVTEAEVLNTQAVTWETFKNVATFTGNVPSNLAFEFLDSDGEPFDPKAWIFRLVDGTLSFGYSHGTLLILR
jgi:autotransporter-associated beta strand protein